MEAQNNNHHGEIIVLPFFGQGHLFPCTELCKHLASHNLKTVLIIPSHLSSSIPTALNDHPLVHVLQIPPSENDPNPNPNPNPTHNHQHHHQHHKFPYQDLGDGIESFIKSKCKSQRPLCAVMDVMMSWSKEIFKRENIPIATFFTCGACATALEYATWKEKAWETVKPGETKPLPGLPDCLSLTYADLQRKGRRGGGPIHPRRGSDWGPPPPGDAPKWVEESEGSSALLINTCAEIEGDFLDYISDQVKKPVLGVGPLLPDSYFKPAASVLSDRQTRANKKSNYTEDEVMKWLDSKPAKSVIYVSFGSEVGPTLEEYDQLAGALRESTHSFIWVIQPGAGKPGPSANLFGGSVPDKGEGYYPKGLEEEIGDRGLIIKGWAPQLLILSHPSTGGFLSHCGWNSTLEAIGRGIPILAWPVRGDQFYNAKLVASYLKIGRLASISGDFSETVKKGDIMEGIDKLMEDKEMQERAARYKTAFEGGFPPSSHNSLTAMAAHLSK